jgi:hypothetical protein
LAARFNGQAASGPLSALPSLEIPPGCARAGEPVRASPSRLSLAVACDGYVFDIAVETFSPRSTASAIVQERRRLTAELAAEDVTVSPLISNGGEGDWTLVQTTEPTGTTAIAVWLRGRPAPSGLTGRLEQARDSVLGGTHAPVLMSISARQPGRVSVESQRQLVAALQKLIKAQADLTTRIEALSRQS